MAVRGIKWPGRANLVVSLVAIRKGKWFGRHTLDGHDVSVISPFLDDSEESGEPISLSESASTVLRKLFEHIEVNRKIEKGKEVLYLCHPKKR